MLCALCSETLPLEFKYQHSESSLDRVGLLTCCASSLLTTVLVSRLYKYPNAGEDSNQGFIITRPNDVIIKLVYVDVLHKKKSMKK